MEKVRLSKSEVADNEMDLIEKMIAAAHKQGLDVKWVDGVISKIEKTPYHNIRAILLEHIDIVYI